MLGPQLELVGRTEVMFEGRRLAFFGGNDYHRLSSHPEVLRALTDAAARYGLNCAGSRMTTGNHPLYGMLEERAAAFLGTEAAAVFSAGYMSATILLQAVGEWFTHLFLDEKAHSSLVDAARQSGLPMFTFGHADPEALQREMRRHLPAGGRPLLLTDGVFANSGAMPPLADYLPILAPSDGRLLLDDAHALGVVGATGRGSWAEAGIPREFVYQVGTLSKGIGGFGGLIAGDAGLIEAIHLRSKAFIGSTPPPLPVAAATIRALELLASEPERIAVLRRRAQRLKPSLRELGFDISAGPAPICSVTFLNETRNRALYERLQESGVYPSFINYPGCPPGGHFRFTLSSAHTDLQIETLLHAIRGSVPSSSGQRAGTEVIWP